MAENIFRLKRIAKKDPLVTPVTAIEKAIHDAVSGTRALVYKGTKTSVSDLPSTGNEVGDIWHVTADGSEWAWNGSEWDELGTTVDVSGKLDIAQGAANAGKFMIVGSDGNIEAVSMQAWQGGSY